MWTQSPQQVWVQVAGVGRLSFWDAGLASFPKARALHAIPRQHHLGYHGGLSHQQSPFPLEGHVGDLLESGAVDSRPSLRRDTLLVNMG